MSMQEAAEQLQYRLAVTDMLSAPDDNGGAYMKLLVVQLLALKIKMYPENGRHKEPHIHIDYGRDRNHVASYAIRTGKRLAGDLDRKYDRDLAKWIEDNRVRLLELWTTVKAGKKTEHLVAALRDPLLDQGDGASTP